MLLKIQKLIIVEEDQYRIPYLDLVTEDDAQKNWNRKKGSKKGCFPRKTLSLVLFNNSVEYPAETRDAPVVKQIQCCRKWN